MEKNKPKRSIISWIKRYGLRMMMTFFVLGIVGFALIVEFALPYWPISPMQRTGDEKPSDYGLPYEAFDIEVDSGIILRGYLINAATKAKATIVHLHGIGGFKESKIPFAKMLSDEGFNVLIYDQRAHGKSGGKYCTFGENEKKDLSKMMDSVLIKWPHVPIGVHGSSMGGAVALQCLEYDERIKFGIVESTFNTLENVIVEYGRDYFQFRSHWLARRVMRKSGEIAQFNPFLINPVESCKNIEQPMLLVHGDIDTNIPIAFNIENFNALKSNDKEFYTVKGATHFDVGEVGGEAYKKKVLDFLNRQTQAILLSPLK
jgi:uncharacterized protein